MLNHKYAVQMISNGKKFYALGRTNPSTGGNWTEDIELAIKFGNKAEAIRFRLNDREMTSFADIVEVPEGRGRFSGIET